jgi:hypothetical protein
MKKIMFATLLFAVAVSMSAVKSLAGRVSKPSSAKIVGDDEKKPIKKEDLPEAVKMTLAGPDYQGWEITAAFSVKKADADYYEIKLKKGDKIITAKLDKEGKKVE